MRHSRERLLCRHVSRLNTSRLKGNTNSELVIQNVWNVLVVVSRWYGGVKLGPDRFSIINNVAREAVVEGGWTRSRRMDD